MAKRLMLIVTLVCFSTLLVGWLKPVDYRTELHTVRVATGETVWEIAEEYINLQDKRMTVGELVDKIYKTNKLNPRLYIQPGQKLIIPVFKEVKNID